jgi:hypothetical protein
MASEEYIYAQLREELARIDKSKATIYLIPLNE